MTVRERLVALALAYENVGVSTNPVKYLALLQSPDPADHTALAAAYFCRSDTSGCALTVRGLWRAAGLEHPLLGAYYLPGRVGHAPLDVLTIAREAGAFVAGRDVASGSYAPQPGDVGYVAMLNGSAEHFFTIVEAKPGQGFGTVAPVGYELATIDGGEPIPDKHGQLQQCIVRRTRSWTRVTDPLFSDRPHFGGSAKQVMGVVDVSRLPFPDLQSCPTERAPTSER